MPEVSGKIVVVSNTEAIYIPESELEEFVGATRILVDPATKALVRDLVRAGVGEDENEIVARAVQSFFVATYPQAHQRIRVLRESKARGTTTD